MGREVVRTPLAGLGPLTMRCRMAAADGFLQSMVSSDQSTQFTTSG